MRNWMDFNDDGKIDGAEMMFAEEMLCTSKEDDIEDDFEMDIMAAGLDVDELEFMDEYERREVLEDAGLDPDDYDFD